MANIIRAKEMLDALKQDFKDSWNTTRWTGDINLETYRLKFNVSEQDIQDYCATLTPMKPIYPACLICGNDWESLDKVICPTNNGQNIDWIDSFDIWCSNEDHGIFTYVQRSDSSCSFNLEVPHHHGFHDNSYEVRWNCHCMIEECYHKNVIVEFAGNYNYKIISEIDVSPSDISLEQIYKLIQGATK